MDIFSILFTLLFGGLALVISLFYSRLRFSMRKGKFTIAKNNSDYFSFGSDFGSFHFKFKEQTLFVNLTNDKRTFSLQQIAGIRYVVDDELALYTERLSLKGTADINNVIHWYTIKLIFKDKSEIPLFIAGEFEPVSWFAEWQSRLEISAFEKQGLVADVDAHCRKVLATLLNTLKNSGYSLSLI